jgi:hypothetical protein
MNTMTAFSHAGPLTLTGDVGVYDPDRRLTTRKVKDLPTANLSLPALGAGEWSWFQPYVARPGSGAKKQEGKEEGNTGEGQGEGEKENEGEDLNAEPVFNAYGFEPKGDLLKPGFQLGPYTAIEGFFQLRHSIMVEDPKKG